MFYWKLPNFSKHFGPTNIRYFLFLTSSRCQLLSKTVNDFVSEISKCSEDWSLDPPDEPADPGDGLGQLVGVVIASPGGRQVGRAEAAEEQGEEEIQNLKK